MTNMIAEHSKQLCSVSRLEVLPFLRTVLSLSLLKIYLFYLTTHNIHHKTIILMLICERYNS
jgi:hypothetical protein